MTYRVETSAQAEAGIDRIFEWLSVRSADGALRWYESVWEVVERIQRMPLACSVAPESDEFDTEIRQMFFGTKRGAVYRALFVVEHDLIRILCVRGPGERPIRVEDIEN